MALKKTVTTKSGITVKGAVHKVREISIQGKNRISFLVKSFASDKESTPFECAEYGCDYTLDGDNPMAQAYEYLSTLEQFKGAESL